MVGHGTPFVLTISQMWHVVSATGFSSRKTPVRDRVWEGENEGTRLPIPWVVRAFGRLLRNQQLGERHPALGDFLREPSDVRFRRGPLGTRSRKYHGWRCPRRGFWAGGLPGSR